MKNQKDKEVLLVISTGLVICFFIFKTVILLYVAIGIGIIGITSSFLSRQIAWAWFKLAEGLGFITSKVLLTVLFYFFLFPIAVISRLFKKNMLQLKKKNAESYYFQRNQLYQSKDIENPW
jgi:hypothetical protein